MHDAFTRELHHISRDLAAHNSTVDELLSLSADIKAMVCFWLTDLAELSGRCVLNLANNAFLHSKDTLNHGLSQPALLTPHR
jgi:hypothetical protein